MYTYIALLRGINVSGKNIIKMDALRLAMQELAYKHVRTYIQSGNIIFESTSKNTATIGTSIKEKITLNFGFNIPVVILTTNYLNQVINTNPFAIINLNKLHVTFLSAIPNQTLANKIIGTFNGDEYKIINNQIYIHCPNGYGKTKLTNTFIEKKLQLQATTRNWQTLIALAEIANQTAS